MINKQEDGTLDHLVKTIAPFWSKDNKNGWNNYPVYIICNDGKTRKIKTIGTKVLPDDWRDRWENTKNKTQELKNIKYNGGIYLLEEKK